MSLLRTGMEKKIFFSTGEKEIAVFGLTMWKTNEKIRIYLGRK